MGRVGWIKLPKPNTSDSLIQAFFEPNDSDEFANIDLTKLKFDFPYAQGSSGKLFTGTYNDLDATIKLLWCPELEKEKVESMDQLFAQEVQILSNLDHPNIAKFIGACKRSPVWCIVTENVKNKSICDFMRKRKRNKPPPAKMAVKQALDVARALGYLHSLGLVHADLRPKNLLIMPNKSIKIAGFGVVHIDLKPEKMTPDNTMYRWMAPEKIQHRAYDRKADVHSFGVVLWQLITGKLPFEEMTAVQAAYAIVKGARPMIPDDCPCMLREIMTRCWDSDPGSRPDFVEIIGMLECTLSSMKTTIYNSFWGHRWGKFCKYYFEYCLI